MAFHAQASLIRDRAVTRLGTSEAEHVTVVPRAAGGNPLTPAALQVD